MIIYSCPDLIFATRISAAADQVGAKSKAAQSPQELFEKLDALADNQKVIVLIDLDIQSAQQIIETARAHKTAPRIIAFGAHVNKQQLKNARQRGADKAMPRSVFVAKLDDIVEKGKDL